MDALNRLLARKRTTYSGDVAGQEPLNKRIPDSDVSGADITADSADVSEVAIETKDDIGRLEDAEVTRRLRTFAIPVRLFGETEEERRERLRDAQRTSGDIDNSGGGGGNDFLSVQRKVESELLAKEIGGIPDLMDVEGEFSTGIHVSKPADGADATEGDHPPSGEAGEGSKGQKVVENLMTCALGDLVGQGMKKEDFVFIVVKRVMKEWGRRLQASGEGAGFVVGSAHHKKMLERHRQTVSFLKPLYKKLKARTLEEDMKNKLHEMMVCVANKKYRDAHKNYIDVSIGNAAWPIGVTKVGIHDRASRTKLYQSHQKANIMSNQATRKFLHGLVRIVSVAQQLYPTTASDCFAASPDDAIGVAV